jgi:hypothetical protein
VSIRTTLRPEPLDRASERVLHGIEPQGGTQRPHQGVGGGVEVARIHVTTHDAHLFAGPKELAQQARLPHATGSKHVQYAKRRFVRGER